MRFGIIGSGRISSNHINAARNNKLQLIAVCDVNPSRLLNYSDFSDAKDVRTYSDYRLMLLEQELDIVAIATPSEMHAAIAKECIINGVNVIIEKPIALGLLEIDEIIQLSSSYGIKAVPCHQNRFNKPVNRLKTTISNGCFGKLFYGLASIRWNRTQEYYNQAEWRGKWRSDGGALMNQSIHNIDLLLWMMGSPVVEVFGYIDNKNHPLIEVEDMGVSLLKFANGSYGIIESSMNTYPENFEETLSIFGEKGTVVLGGKSVNKIVHWNVKNDPIDDLDEFNEEVDSVYGNGHVALYKDLIEAIESRREPCITLQDGRNAVEVILAIYLSSFEKRPVQLPLSTDTSTIMFEGKLIK
jgi:UDP-N-acetyl-2-amino-2-deoxyglucuronate dehydrogenase